MLKGGLLGDKIVTGKDVEALADLPSRDVLLGQLAGTLQAPIVKLASLLQALPRNLAYGLQAMLDQRSDEAAPAESPTIDEPEAASEPDAVAEATPESETQEQE